LTWPAIDILQNTFGHSREMSTGLQASSALDQGRIGFSGEKIKNALKFKLFLPIK
jgi:hypothetical protein